MRNHLTELLDVLGEEAYSEATCREPDARLNAGGASLGRSASKAWLGRRAKLSGLRPGWRKRLTNWPPGAAAGGRFFMWGKPGFPHRPLLGYRRAAVSEAGMNPASRRLTRRLAALQSLARARGGRAARSRLRGMLLRARSRRPRTARGGSPSRM